MENDRQPDQRLKIDLGPFRHHAVEYLAAMPPRNVRTLSAAFIADLQEDWEKYGTQILELMREKFPDLYFASIVKLAQIVRIEADVSLKEPKPKTIEEVLQRVEHETGVEGRRAFEGFLKKMHKTKEEQDG